ncbi:hypothetical protein [Rhodalgimonas zhirmunskyi]|uniref:Ferrochelatase n=1 Tax=Rhodalgimonas zhirmunskyi TaxID=2964767 RepID=A0AAJ1UCW2_9RHOB|nr:hypothetical protein [Rhodoalgimonas zhirmunskyi]MDQ2095193.1 hypothetical protein [Rhodoalgimonas zhirmunskyi]
MKAIFTAAAIAVLSTNTANAGSLSDPVIDRDVIVADTSASSSSTGLVLVLLVTAAMIAAVAD